MNTIAIQALDAMIGGAADITEFAEALTVIAERRGFVVTIETRPLRPLSMGHHEAHVTVRPRRGVTEAEVRAKILEANDAAVGRRYAGYVRSGR